MQGEHVKRDLGRLVEQTRPSEGLAPAAPAVGIGEAVGFSKPRPAAPTAGDGTGGIASPLAEADYTARTWHDPEILTSTDGLFSFLVRRVASITMTDANNDEVVLNFANKPSSEE